MHTQSFLSLALSASLVAAATNGCAYPSIASTISKCNTAAAFCSSVLGRGPTTTTISEATYTTTVPVSIFTYSQVKSTKTKLTTLTTTDDTVTRTVNKCRNTSPGGAMQPAVTAVAAVVSCGVGRYSSSWIATACQCDFDKTVYSAATTVTVSSGTSIFTTKASPITTATSIVASTTHTVTTTVVHDNCVPPANSTCLNPFSCTDYNYYTFVCGNSDYYECECGLDITGRPTCYDYYDLYNSCSDPTQRCTANYDCAEGYFCLQAYCGCYDTLGVCAPADVCLGDTVIISTRTYSSFAKRTAAPTL